MIIFGLILNSDWGNVKEIIRKVFITGLLSFLPFLFMNVYTFIYYDGYTYLDWFGHQQVYQYQNRVVEFIKSFGSIYNFGWFLFFPGMLLIIKRYKEVFSDKNLLLVFQVLVSCFSVLLWPVVTRVLFITMPGVILVSCFFLQRINSRLYFIYPFVVFYIISGYLMDSFILDFVNLPF